MKSRFTALWNAFGAQGNAEQAFCRLAAMHAAPGRHYHNLDHVKNCLAELDSVRRTVAHADLVELALWYHDAIYDTHAHDNEARSAQLAYDVCVAAHLPSEIACPVKELILATRHTASPTSVDAEYMVDIDLAILGKPEAAFDDYEGKIRQEYAWVADDQFKKGRTAVLRTFLERHSIYATDIFSARYEAQARKNLQRSIDALR